MDGQDWHPYHAASTRPPSSESAFVTWLIVAIIVSTAAVYAIRHFARFVPREAPSVVPQEVRPAVETSGQAPSDSPTADMPAPPQIIYRCASGSGVVYGDQMPCEGRLTITRVPVATTDDLSPRLSDYQQEMLRSADERIAGDAAAARMEMASMVIERDSHQECATLATEIQAIDAHTRQPLSSHEQDRWRARRQEVTSRQHARHC